MKLPPGEQSQNKYRQVVYVIQATVLADDNNYAFHRNVSAVIQRAFRDRLPTIHATMIDVQCKNFHLWPTLPTPALRHSEEERATARGAAPSTTKPVELHPLVLEARTKTAEAITQFGIHPFMDKGPTEVMDVDALLEKITVLPAEEAEAVLIGILDLHHDPSISRHVWAVLVSTLLVHLQDQPDPWWNAVMQNDRLAQAL